MREREREEMGTGSKAVKLHAKEYGNEKNLNQCPNGKDLEMQQSCM